MNYQVKKSNSIREGIINFDFFSPELEMSEQISKVTGEASIRLDNRFIPYLPPSQLKYQLETRKGTKYEIELTTEEVEELFRISSCRKLAYSMRTNDPDATSYDLEKWDRILFGYFITAYK